MGVVSPMMCGVGGDLFAIVAESGGGLHGVNASGWAPAGLTPGLLASKGFGEMPQRGAHSVTVPGAVSGWSLLHERFGRTPLSAVLQPGIAIAEEGFPVAEIAAAEWANVERFLRDNAEAAATFLPDGRAPRVGKIFRNPGLASTYRLIASGGPDGYYRGDVARPLFVPWNSRAGLSNPAICPSFAPNGSIPSVPRTADGRLRAAPERRGRRCADDAQHPRAVSRREARPQFGAPRCICSSKRRSWPTPTCDGTSAIRSSPRCRCPRCCPRLTRASAPALIDLARAVQRLPPGTLPSHGGDTIYLSVVDRDGNMVSLIQSNFASFGSGVVAGGTGFALQNRGGLLHARSRPIPNVLAPRKRPLHTIIPGFMRRGRLRVAFGIMGGWNQSQAHAQFVSNVVDHEMNIQAALEAPRLTKLTFDGCDVTVESRIPESVRTRTGAKGARTDRAGGLFQRSGRRPGGDARRCRRRELTARRIPGRTARRYRNRYNQERRNYEPANGEQVKRAGKLFASPPSLRTFVSLSSCPSWIFVYLRVQNLIWNASRGILPGRIVCT